MQLGWLGCDTNYHYVQLMLCPRLTRSTLPDVVNSLSLQTHYDVPCPSLIQHYHTQSTLQTYCICLDPTLPYLVDSVYRPTSIIYALSQLDPTLPYLVDSVYRPTGIVYALSQLDPTLPYLVDSVYRLIVYALFKHLVDSLSRLIVMCLVQAGKSCVDMIAEILKIINIDYPEECSTLLQACYQY